MFISQYDFKNILGIENSLANTTKDIINDNLDNHNKTIDIFLDLSKAFDTIPHTTPLNSLSSFVITGSGYAIFETLFRK